VPIKPAAFHNASLDQPAMIAQLKQNNFSQGRASSVISLAKLWRHQNQTEEKSIGRYHKKL
jgi:hypothetical protein